MATSITNKANIKPIPVDSYEISAADVVNFLQNELGFALTAYDFTRWMGASVDNSYVRFRAVISYNDIEQNAAGLKFKDTIINVLKKYMYPKTIKDDPETFNHLRNIGIFEDRLNYLMANSRLKYNKEANVFTICLGPEYILKDMLSDPVTGEVPGKFMIVAVLGTTPETIRWKVNVVRNMSTTRNTDVSLDSLFNTPGIPSVQ